MPAGRTRPRLTFSAPGNLTKGMRVSGSVAMPASSTRTCRTWRPLRLAAAAQEQVHSTTLWRPSSNFRAFPRTFLYLRGEAGRHPGAPRPEAARGSGHLQSQILLGEDLPSLQPSVESPDVLSAGVGGLPDQVVQGDAPVGGGSP